MAIQYCLLSWGESCSLENTTELSALYPDCTDFHQILWVRKLYHIFPGDVFAWPFISLTLILLYIMKVIDLECGTSLRFSLVLPSSNNATLRLINWSTRHNHLGNFKKISLEKQRFTYLTPNLSNQNICQ